MEKFKVGMIGCGGRGKWHAAGYAFAEGAEMVACADPDAENAAAFAEQFGIAGVYGDYREMLEKEDLDIVSNATWTMLHTSIILDVAQSGVKAIHSEKPMATTWGEAKQQHQAAVDHGVQLTYCHQRRFHLGFYKARQLVKEGVIGELKRVEGTCRNMFDWGTHWFNMFCFYNDDQPPEAVIGQIDPKDTHVWFDVPMEGGAVAWIRWKNGLQGLMVTGHAGDVGADNFNRLIGTDGIIEVGLGPDVRYLSAGSKGWQTPELTGTPFDDSVARILEEIRDPQTGDPLDLNSSKGLHIVADVLAVSDVVECLKSGREPALSSRTALQSSELIFATYESSRRRAQVLLPLDVDDSAFLSMLEDGTLVRS